MVAPNERADHACGGDVLLLWFAQTDPNTDQMAIENPANDPALVNRHMIETLRPCVADILEIVMPRGDTDGMSFAPLETLSARDRMSLAAHAMAADALAVPLRTALF